MADIEKLGWLLFTKQLMMYSLSDDSGSTGNPKGERFLTEVWKSAEPG